MDSKKSVPEGILYVVTNEWQKGLTGINVTDDFERDLRALKKYLPGETKIHVEYTYSNFFDGVIDLIKIKNYFEDFILQGRSFWIQCPVSVILNQIEVHYKNKKTDFYKKLELPNNTKIRSIEDLSKFCESWRRKNNISEKEIADLSNLSEEFIFQLENGECNSQISDCLKVISLLGFDLFAVKRSL
jgi:DNA-binding XRE family transcriptional regulator